MVLCMADLSLIMHIAWFLKKRATKSMVELKSEFNIKPFLHVNGNDPYSTYNPGHNIL